MKRPIATGLFLLAGIAFACGDQLPDAGGDGVSQVDGGDGSTVGEDGASTDDGATSGDGGMADGPVDANDAACPPAPGFCVGFETAAVFGPWAKSESGNGVVSITTTTPKEGIGALSGVASGGSGQASAAVTTLAVGDFKSFDCTMWLRAPNGWAGSYDVLSIGTFGVGGFQAWRVSLGVTNGKAVVASDTTTDAGANASVPKLGGAIEATPTGGWVFAHLAFSSGTSWAVSGTIGDSTANVTAPDPSVVHDAQFFVGLSRAAYASSPPPLGFALDVDDLRCAIAK
jgi:hypothetical protein